VSNFRGYVAIDKMEIQSSKDMEGSDIPTSRYNPEFA
jgi:hypothetical protein